MSELVAWIRAQLDATEAAAMRIPQPYRLYISHEGRLSEPLADDDGQYAQWADGEDRMPNHITNWELVFDPAAMLADVASKRAILDAYEQAAEFYGRPENRHLAAGEVHGLHTAVKLLAEGFRGRPGYEEAMRDE